MAHLLTDEAVRAGLEGLPDWKRDGDTIIGTFQFEGFAQAINFVNRVADEAEAADHHPDIDIRWNKVTLRLSTHSEGGLTDLDLHLAKRIDEVRAPALNVGDGG